MSNGSDIRIFAANSDVGARLGILFKRYTDKLA